MTVFSNKKRWCQRIPWWFCGFRMVSLDFIVIWWWNTSFKGLQIVPLVSLLGSMSPSLLPPHSTAPLWWWPHCELYQTPRRCRKQTTLPGALAFRQTVSNFTRSSSQHVIYIYCKKIKAQCHQCWLHHTNIKTAPYKSKMLNHQIVLSYQLSF